MYTNRRNFRVQRKSGSRNTMVTIVFLDPDFGDSRTDFTRKRKYGRFVHAQCIR